MLAKKRQDASLDDMAKMREALAEVRKENCNLSQNVIREHQTKEKLEKSLKG